MVVLPNVHRILPRLYLGVQDGRSVDVHDDWRGRVVGLVGDLGY